MQLSELTVRGFADLLGSDAPAPGGGSAAALAGALGAALTAMVGSLTVGKRSTPNSMARPGRPWKRPGTWNTGSWT